MSDMEQETPQPVLIPAAAVSKCFIACPPSPDSVPTLWDTPIALDDASTDVTTSTKQISLCQHLLHRAHAQLEAAFSYRHQFPVSELLELKAVAICSPHTDHIEAVDAAVVFLAHRLHADVVILDPADLAAGGDGVFGPEFTAALWADLDDSGYSQEGSSGAKCVEALVRMRPDSIEVSQRRILYLHDFGALVNHTLISAIAACVSQSPDVLVVVGTAPMHTAPASSAPALSAEYTPQWHWIEHDSLQYFQQLYRTSLSYATTFRGKFDCLEDFHTALFAARYLGSSFLQGEGRYHETSPGFFQEDASLELLKRIQKELEPLEHIKQELDMSLEPLEGIKKEVDEMVENMQLTRNYWTIRNSYTARETNFNITSVIRVALSQEMPRALLDGFEITRRRRFISTNLRMLSWSLRAAGKSLKCSLIEEEWCNLLQGGPEVLHGIDVQLYSNEMREDIAELLPDAATADDILHVLQRLAGGQVEWKRQLKRGTEDRFCDPIVEQVKTAVDLTEQERGLLSCIVDPASVNTTFADVHIPDATIEALRTVVTLPLVAPSAYSKGILATESGAGVLLYGPPGTGKTMACRALVQESRVRMLQVQASTIMRCYVGQSEEMVTAIFSLARRLGPCIVFIDELDSIFGCRNETTPVWHTSVLTEFMQEMDGLRTADINRQRGVIVVGATNRPQDLDYAVIRRLPRRILVDLPGVNERESILRHYLRDEECDPTVDIRTLAVKTTLFSGSDLRNLVLAATLNAVKAALPKNWQNNKGMRDPLQNSSRTLRPEHFTQALKEISASCATDMSGLEQVRQWSRTGRPRAVVESSQRAQQPSAAEIRIPLPADWMCR